MEFNKISILDSTLPKKSLYYFYYCLVLLAPHMSIYTKKSNVPKKSIFWHNVAKSALLYIKI